MLFVDLRDGEYVYVYMCGVDEELYDSINRLQCHRILSSDTRSWCEYKDS